MKNLILTILLISTIGISNTCIDLKKNDTTFAINYLQVTMQKLEHEIQNLSSEELNYTPKDGSWSIMNCLEHIAITEPAIVDGIKKIIDKNEVVLDKDLIMNDGLVIANIADRTKKAKTPKPLEPLGKWKSVTEVMKIIKQNRALTIKLLKETDADLRHLFGKYPYGEVDAYQLFIVSAAHGYRHTMQIREILEKYKKSNSH